MKPVILFDVNETMLNMSPLKKKINRLLGSSKGFRIWFGMLLQYSLVDNCTDNYHDFASTASATLDMAAKTLMADLDEKEKKAALQSIKELPAYDDVPKGLKLLKENGFRLATLTNSSTNTLVAQLQYAELTEYFEATLSIDTIKKYKPSLETYKWAADQLSADVSEAILVAAHGWDIAGALQAGLQAAFIERKGQSVYPLAPKPTFTGKDFVDIAKQIISRYKQER
ncbi:haloacid dehalogenase type II [Flavisolibacter nicotianae]|uniref:haloacid dehalogenase type II n=1 Tax=Flavisolibacter nicotianae TaxID=2364882 RepID=UPI000EAC44B3|nr:haloacid dehalogenase type II [Flavisolibacter nicotianae]